MDAIQVEELTKVYGSQVVLDRISFSVRQGETFALLGVNGAGKTTTLECLEGIRPSDGGCIHVCGFDVAKDSRNMREILGVQLQNTALGETMNAKEAMQLFCAWHKKPYREDLLVQFGLTEYLKKPYAALSMGRKRRLHLALALCHNPRVLILDEPTAGLDVAGRHALHHEIRELKKQGTTILMATHDMDEAETLCDRIAFLREGAIVKCGTPLELTASVSLRSKVILKTKRPLKNIRLLESKKELEDGYISFTSRDISSSLMALLEEIQREKNELLDLRVERASLEDIFLSIAGGN